MLENSLEKYDQYISEIQEIEQSVGTLRDKYLASKQFLERLCKDITRGESLQFSSLFSRLVFISNKYHIDRHSEKQLHKIRINASFLLRDKNNRVSSFQFDKAIGCIKYLLSTIYIDRVGEDVDLSLKEESLRKDILPPHKIDYARVEIIDISENTIIGKSSDAENTIIHIKYNTKRTGEIFKQTIDHLWIGAQLNILDSIIDADGRYIPSVIVLEPDYLVDASALAECFQNYSWSHLHYFRKKFEQASNTKHILLGNLANFFLDQLTYSDDPQSLNFENVFFEAFKQKPFEFTSCNEIAQADDFKLFMAKSLLQFTNIKRVIINDLNQNNIDVYKCILEPSFLCERYGVQGRLDLLQSVDSEQEKFKIIELKSGGLPFPKNDPGKIAINHEVQTAIYRLIIQTVYKAQPSDILSAILYSAAENDGENLRFAAPYQSLDKEIINIRNLIVATEHKIYSGDGKHLESLFSQIFDRGSYEKIPQFFADQLTGFEKTIMNQPELIQKYFFRFVSFITRELYIQKTGNDGYDSNVSTAGLWNTEFAERQESYDLISDLEIISIDSSGQDMKIRFERNNKDEFSNFRQGDICILYPHADAQDTVLTNQIFKGNVAEISPDHILLRFRYKQNNRSIFDKYRFWAIEHDWLDHSYTNMYKNLFSFLKSPIYKKQLLLGLDVPQANDPVQVGYILNSEVDNITEKQQNVLSKAIAAKDYFLIVGPPGTGKTSIFARHLIEYYFDHSAANMLIIAYTNRAVDELCDAINKAFKCEGAECENYIRIGTELSCGVDYRHRLLQNIAGDVKSRKELLQTIRQQRIIIGTQAAIMGKPELFDLKQFDLAIIDEASQILEPQIIGLLPQVSKFIMIGDHKQLSTITLQDQNKSKISDNDLNNIGIYNCNESLFERLYRTCEQNGWSQAYDTLIYQGRMHQDIAKFTNYFFYDNQLLPASLWQNEDLHFEIENSDNKYQQVITKNRVAFFDNQFIDNKSCNHKVNDGEARIISDLCINIIKIYNKNKLTFIPEQTIGIITPYRNQIALIKYKLQETNIPELQNIMVDTVERFQGSQRDIILLSFCMNKAYQLDFFCNLNTDQTVDRKLNVAITRARKQLFLVGNSIILNKNNIYKSLLSSIYKY
ncbi:MAG: AAA domain-containing protein [Dysgonomonas sp.]